MVPVVPLQASHDDPKTTSPTQPPPPPEYGALLTRLCTLKQTLPTTPFRASVEESIGQCFVDLAVLELNCNNNAPAAITLLHDCLAALPDCSGAWYNLSVALMVIGDRTGAVAALKSCLQRDPGNAIALSNLGALLTRDGDLAEAVGLLQQAVAIARFSNVIVVNYVDCLLAIVERLLTSTDRGLLPPDHTALAVATLGTHVVARLYHIDAVSPTTSSEPPAALRAAKPQSLLMLCRKIAKLCVRTAPTSVKAWQSMSTLHSMLGHARDAVVALVTATLLAPDDVALLLHLAGQYDATGNAPACITTLEKAVERAPRSVDALSFLGAYLSNAGLLGRGTVHLSAALAASPEASSAMNSFAGILRDIGRIDYAMPYYNAACAQGGRFGVVASQNRLFALLYVTAAVEKGSNTGTTLGSSAGERNSIQQGDDAYWCRLPAYGTSPAGSDGLYTVCRVAAEHLAWGLAMLQSSWAAISCAAGGVLCPIIAPPDFDFVAQLSSASFTSHCFALAALRDSISLSTASIDFQPPCGRPTCILCKNGLHPSLCPLGAVFLAYYVASLGLSSPLPPPLPTRLLASQVLKDKLPAVSPLKALSICRPQNVPPNLSAFVPTMLDYLKGTAAQVPLHRRLPKNWYAIADVIRVAYMTPDARRHSCSYFLHPLLAGHRLQEMRCQSPVQRNTTPRFEVYVLSNCARTTWDDKTSRIAGVLPPGRFIDISEMTVTQVATLIAVLRIHIVVELAGHSAGSRLDLMCLKPSPISFTWLGYPWSTGVSSIDFRITDSLADPASALDIAPLYAEKIVRNDPCFLCYSPDTTEYYELFHIPDNFGFPAYAKDSIIQHNQTVYASFSQETWYLAANSLFPSVQVQPFQLAPDTTCLEEDDTLPRPTQAESSGQPVSPGSRRVVTIGVAPPAASLANDGTVAFGTFNNLSKVTAPVLRCWAEVMKRLPNSRFVMKAKPFGCDSVRQYIIDLFQDCGVADIEQRVAFAPLSQSHRRHLESFAAMDVAVEPWPYAGTTSTCEALWMGLPVVVYSPRNADGSLLYHPMHVSESILQAVSLPEFIARSHEQYIAIICALLADREALERYRQRIRAAMVASPLCLYDEFAQRMEALYRTAVTSVSV